MRCPHCQLDLNDPQPECPDCHFHIRDLDAELGEPPGRADAQVVDLAGALSAGGAERLRSHIAAWSARTGHDMVVVIVADTSPRRPSEYVFWLFNRWRVGGDAHTGVAVLLALAERRIEVEVGVALERYLTDAAAALVLETHAVPFLSAGDLDAGLFHAADILGRVIWRAGQVGA